MMPLTDRTNTQPIGAATKPTKDVTCKLLAPVPLKLVSSRVLAGVGSCPAGAPLDRIPVLPLPLTPPPATPVTVTVADSEIDDNEDITEFMKDTMAFTALSNMTQANLGETIEPIKQHTPQKASLSDGEKVALLGLALQQSNSNLESSHSVIRSLQSQIEEMKHVATMLMTRMTKKVNTTMSTTTVTPTPIEAPQFDDASTIASINDCSSSIASPICSRPSSPHTAAPASTAAAASVSTPASCSTLSLPQSCQSCLDWPAERDELLRTSASLRDENASLRREIESLKRAKVDEVASLRTELSHLHRTLETSLNVRRKLSNELQRFKGNIRVVCRRHTNLLSFDVGAHRSPLTFEFDSTLGPSSSMNSNGITSSTQSQQLFEEAEGLISSVLDGYNVTILAYGISGSGKTHAMEGTPTDPGLNRRALESLFRQMDSQSGDYLFEVRLQMVEIYIEQIRDCLVDYVNDVANVDRSSGGSGGICEIQTVTGSGHGALPQVTLKGAVTLRVHTLNEIESALERGYATRASGSTSTNQRSSRSHCIVMITIHSEHRHTGTRVSGKLVLTDLAGSEDVSKSEVEGQQLRESQQINKSLAALSLVFQALAQKQTFVPYRNSRLTHLLSDSLGGGGNSKSLLVLCLNPTESVQSGTLQSIKFGQTVRTVKIGGVSGSGGGGGASSTNSNGITPNIERKAQKRTSIAIHATATGANTMATSNTLGMSGRK